MGNTITLVSAFFYIGRDKVKDTDLVRSNKQYFEYFEQWARMRNKLIVYTEPEFVDEVYRIREQFGVREQTIVLPVEDVFAIEKELLERMEAVSANEDFRNYRHYVNAMSNNAKYDYVMLMKYWCLQDAVRRGLVEDTAAWIDFGFNHGGELFANPEEFDFLWEYKFTRKIHLFALYNPDTVLGVRSWQTQKDCMMGPLIVLPKELCEEFWLLVKGALEALLWLDCIDDDQQLLLMAYKHKKEVFEVHISEWCLPLKEYGGTHLTVKQKVLPKKSLLTRVRVAVAWLRGRTPDQMYAKRIGAALNK